MADKQRAAGAGFDEHLTKPVSPERLDEVIAVYGQRARSHAVGNGSQQLANPCYRSYSPAASGWK
jgi:DNA-binding response OmpR family regulator